MIIELDLYKSYKERFGEGKLTQLAVDKRLDESVIFYGLFRILLACDAVHDFCGTRGFKKPSKETFVVQLMNELIKDLNNYNILDVCERLIGTDGFEQFKIDDKKYFSTETNSKIISKKILNLFGLRNVPLAEIGQHDCTGDNSIIRMVKILKRSYNNNLPVEIRVDATSNSSSLIPIYSSILELYSQPNRQRVLAMH